MNKSIVLTTANARFSHSSMGLRCLFANLDEYQDQAIIDEHTIKDSADSMVKSWMSFGPKIIGIGVYIWNIEILTEAINLLRKSHPEVIIVLGGPEISHGIESSLFQQVNYIVQLEGEEVFKNLCHEILTGNLPKQKTIKADVLDTSKIKMPYEYYTDSDIKNRKIYVEASRGCAFKCHFCLSSLDNGVRNFDVDIFLAQMQKLYDRGVRQFKFVDRTFNLDIKLSTRILTFFLEKEDHDFFLHFEVIPDRLPQALKEYIVKFKPGILQFEVGIQTLDKEVSKRIGRRQNKEKALENLSYLRHETNAHLHVDLIIGLPGANLEIFKNDLNELVGIGLQEVQVGMLKLLKGTPLYQHIDSHQLKFENSPPYEIQSNIDIDKELMQKMRALHKFWDKFYNSGNFIGTMKYLFSMSNPFDEFFALSNYAHQMMNRTYGISLDDLCGILYKYLLEKKSMLHADARELILKDILIKKGRKIPNILKDYNLGLPEVTNKQSSKSLDRQSNHQ
jgi:radical SAM superfamily enzyme YgiQ (UPF0313 family)